MSIYWKWSFGLYHSYLGTWLIYYLGCCAFVQMPRPCLMYYKYLGYDYNWTVERKRVSVDHVLARDNSRNPCYSFLLASSCISNNYLTYFFLFLFFITRLAFNWRQRKDGQFTSLCIFATCCLLCQYTSIILLLGWLREKMLHWRFTKRNHGYW